MLTSAAIRYIVRYVFEHILLYLACLVVVSLFMLLPVWLYFRMFNRSSIFCVVLSLIFLYYCIFIFYYCIFIFCANILLFQLWSLYCDIIKLHGEYSEQSSPIVLEFWGIVTPGILHLLTKSKEVRYKLSLIDPMCYWGGDAILCNKT